MPGFLQVNETPKRAIDRVRRGRWVLFTFHKPTDETYTKVGERSRRETAEAWLSGADT